MIYEHHHWITAEISELTYVLLHSFKLILTDLNKKHIAAKSVQLFTQHKKVYSINVHAISCYNVNIKYERANFNIIHTSF